MLLSLSAGTSRKQQITGGGRVGVGTVGGAKDRTDGLDPLDNRRCHSRSSGFRGMYQNAGRVPTSESLTYRYSPDRLMVGLL